MPQARMIAFFSCAIVACSASPAARAPEKLDSKAHQEQATPAQASPPAPARENPFAAQPTFSLADEEAEFARAEKKAVLAMEGKDDRGVALSTEASADRCTIVCKALASMRISAERICQLDSSRCASVRERVNRSEQRAKDSCPACSGPT